jgi:hypothetical protein
MVQDRIELKEYLRKHRAKEKIIIASHSTGPFAATAAFCRLISLQLPSSQLVMAEACGSRTQTLPKIMRNSPRNLAGYATCHGLQAFLK